MIVARLRMTSSFKHRIEYLFRHGHDLFAVTQHVVSPARLSAPEMDGTWTAQPRLKAAAGIRRGGRRCVKPVSHDILSWDADEAPDFEEMIRTARSFLAAIGLDGHQAVMVGHEHNGKRHVHIVANAVHPVTGRVADRTNDHHRAQAWGLAYEQAQGRVRCRHRTAPRMGRAFALAATGKKESGERLSRAAFEKKRRRTAADAEAKKRHKAEAWARLIVQQGHTAANIAPPADKQKADNLPAPRP